MKGPVILIIMLLTSALFTTAYAQENYRETCLEIADIDEQIYLRDINKIKSLADYNQGDTIGYGRFNDTTKSIVALIRKKLLPLLLDPKAPDLVAMDLYLGCIRHTETVSWLEFVLLDKIESAEILYTNIDSMKNRRLHPGNSPEVLKQAHALLTHRIEEIMDNEFVYYSFTETSHDWLKGIYVEHANDVFFVPFGVSNDDRDFTGGFRFEFFTDKVKLRVLGSNSDNWWNPNSRSWYSYQSIFIGGEGYTPFLRDTLTFNSPTAFDPNDRPYASFKYFGRAKYRIFRTGSARIFTQLKLGSIGSSSPQGIQSIIHRDIVYSSVTPNGWDAQIAAGGRIAVSWEAVPEIMLSRKASTTSSCVFTPSLFGEFKVGYDMTSAGLGFNLSNRNFKETGGIRMPKVVINYDSHKGNWKNMLLVNNKTMYRYVIHNTMLEGYGIFNRIVDEDPDTPQDVHFLTGDQVVRHVFINELALTVRFRYVSFYIKQTIMSPEFDLPVNDPDYFAIVDGEPVSRNASIWNHYGTFGLLFTME